MGVRVVCSRPTWLENESWERMESMEDHCTSSNKHWPRGKEQHRGEQRFEEASNLSSGKDCIVANGVENGREQDSLLVCEDKAVQVNLISPSGRPAASSSSMVSELESLARFDKELQLARAERAAALELLADTRLELRHAHAKIATLEAQQRKESKEQSTSPQETGTAHASPFVSPCASSSAKVMMTPPTQAVNTTQASINTSPYGNTSINTKSASLRRIGSARETALSQAEYRAQAAEARAEALASQVPLLKCRVSSFETQIGLSSLISKSPGRVPALIEMDSQTTAGVGSQDSVSSLIARCETASLALELTCKEKAAKRAEYEAAKMSRSARKTKEDLRKKECELEETREKLEDEIDSLRGKIEKFKRRERSTAVVGTSLGQEAQMSRLQKPTQSSMARTENSGFHRIIASPRSTSAKKKASPASSMRRSPLSELRNVPSGFGPGSTTSSANVILW